MLHGFRRFSLLTTALFGLGTAQTSAADLTWEGDVGSSNWSACTLIFGFCANSNWAPGTSRPSTGDSLIFANNGSPLTSTNDYSGLSLSKITVNTGRPSSTINGNKLTLTGDNGVNDNGIVNDASSTLTLNLDLSLSGNIGFNSRGTTTANGVISGSALNKTGTGTLILNSANTYTGATTVTQGTLRIGTNDAIRTANTVNIQTNGRLDLSGRSQTLAQLLGSGSIQMTSGTLTLGGSNTTFAYDGNIFGSNGSLVKNGTGTLTLGGFSSFTGGVTINRGRVAISNNSNLGDTSGRLTIGDANLQATASFSMNRTTVLASSNSTIDVLIGRTLNHSGLIQGGGSLNKRGGGTLALYRPGLAYGGATNIIQGRLQLGNSNVLSDTTTVNITSGATFDLNGRVDQIGALTGSGFVDLGSTSGHLRVGGNHSSTTYTGRISGAGQLTKLGLGTLTLANQNTYTGNTSVAGGTLRFGTSNVLNAQTDVYVATNSTLDLNGRFGTINGLSGNGNVTLGGGSLTVGQFNATSTFNGNITGANLIKRGAGTLTLSGSNSLTGTITVDSGTLSVGSLANLGGSFGTTLLRNSSTLRITSSFGSGRSLNIQGLGQIEVSGGQEFIQSSKLSGFGTLTKSGVGTLRLVGSNTFNGTLQISQGQVRMTTPNAFGTSNSINMLSGTTLQLSSGSQTFRQITGNGVVDIQTGRLTLGNGNSSSIFFGTIKGGGALDKTGGGTVTLTGNNTYTGQTRVLQGTLALNGTTQTSDVRISSGATLDLSGRSSLDPFSAAMVNNGRVNAGAGTTFSGDVTGGGDFIGMATFAGQYGPGNSPALVTHDTTVFDASNTLIMELGGLLRGTEYDAINANSVTLGGILDIDLISGFGPSSGDTFDLIIANQILGAFSSFSFASLSGGLFFSTNLFTNNLGQMVYQLVVEGQSGGDGVPGPGAIFILVVGLAGMGVMRKRSA